MTVWPYYLGGAAVLAFIFRPKRAAAALAGLRARFDGVALGQPRGEPVSASRADRQALIRTLLAETSGSKAHSDTELAGIANVGINRAAKGGRTLAAALTPPGKPLWNSSTVFKDRWNAAHQYPAYGRVEGVVDRVLSRELPNPIGGRDGFFHPRGLPRPSNGECAPNRYLWQDDRGNPRCFPLWGRNNPLTIGRAVFTGLNP